MKRYKFFNGILFVLIIFTSLISLISASENIPFHRYSNGPNHFYTNNIEEVRNSPSWIYEGLTGYLEKDNIDNTVALKRYYNNKINTHLYTTEHSYDNLTDFNYEGIVGYIYTSQINNSIPLYRYYNLETRDNFYTTNDKEIKNDSVFNIFIGIEGYILKNNRDFLPYPEIDNYKIKGLTASADGLNKDEVINNYAGRVALNLKWYEWEPRLSITPPCSSNEYEYDNHCFVIDKGIDKDILEWSSRGLIITGVIYGVPEWARISDCPLGNSSFCAPKNSEDYGRFNGMVAKRYNGLNFNGRISDFVIHNEVNVNSWFNVGCGQGEPCDKDYWINEYSNNYNSAYDKIKSEQPEAKVLISLDHQFDTSFDKLNDYDPTISGKTFLIEFSKKVGDRKWQVAFHPYPKNIFSNEISFNDMPYVTFGNIGMLVGWLRQNFPNNPSSWNVQITEAGINSLSPSSPEKQASTLCNAFRNVLATPKIESFLYHRMKDHKFELNNGLALGLRNSDSSTKPTWVTWALANRKDVNILFCGFEDLPYTRLKRGYNSNIGHIVSSRILPNDFNIEWSDVGLLRDEVADSVLLYECLAYKGHTLISKNPNCEGLTPMGPVGYILQTQKSNTIPIWRCSINNGADHIVSKFENCENQQKEMLLGYGYRI